MRWYDVEPDVYMAISMIECSESPKQLDCANYIITRLKEKDPYMHFMNGVNNTRSQRWYDKDETISTAFEYLKNTTKNLQKEIALDVLAYMNIDKH